MPWRVAAGLSDNVGRPPVSARRITINRRRMRMPQGPSTSTSADLLAFVEHRWEEDVLPTLTRYIEIPAKSPAFDPAWAANGHIDRAVTLIEDWARRRPIE